ncbi:remorin [Quercus suber]|uniref:Remorin n=1 Tax=Quercus suber TaxID=58331 RepID=A0AAW0KWT9_QUESU
METEVMNKVEPVTTPAISDPPLASAEVPNDVAREKAAVRPQEPKPDDSKAITLVEKTPEPVVKKDSKGSIDRDVALADVEKEKRLAQKKLSAVTAWENSKKASLEADLRKIEEQLEKKKANYAEKMKNKAALIHKQAEEKKAMIEARRGEELLKAEETSAKYRATGTIPKKFLGCF